MSDITKLVLESTTYARWLDPTAEDLYWADSQFGCFRRFASRTKGKEGEHLTADVLELLGSIVPRHQKGKKKGQPFKPAGAGTDYDVLIDDYEVEVKTSSAWQAQSNNFAWQQFRPFQEYIRVICVGINANQVQAWWCTKEDLEKHIFGRDEFRQHGGKKGEQELYWISTPGGDTAEVPAFFRSMDTWND